MEWIFLEALVALVLAVGIVWWTMGPKSRKRPPRRRRAALKARQCSTRGTDSVNTGISASNAWPSSAIIW